MSGDDVYQEELLRVAREAAGAGRLAPPASTAERDNPLCGDRVAFDVRLEAGRIAALAHRVRGCLVCQASAAFLSRAAAGAGAAELRAGRDQVAALLSAGAPVPAGRWSGAALFAPVGPVRSRHGCVLLPFDTLAEAVAGWRG